MNTGLITEKTQTDQIWTDFSGRIHSFVKKRVNNDADADDIIQEIILKIHRNLPRLKDSGKILPWIYSVSRSAIADHYREKRIPGLRAELVSDLEYEEDKISHDGIDDVAVEIRRCLEPFIEALPEKYREALLADMSGVSQTEYAKRNGLSISGAKSRIQRARKMLRKSLFDCCDFALDKYGNVLDYKRKNAGCESC